MTQMGLDYTKYLETARHNLQDEGIRTASNAISQQDANTRKYVASFEPQRVDAVTSQADSAAKQAQASALQAAVAQGKLNLDALYRERETVAKETAANASKSQALQAGIRNENDYETALMKMMPGAPSGVEAAKRLGFDTPTQAYNGIIGFWDDLIKGIV